MHACLTEPTGVIRKKGTTQDLDLKVAYVNRPPRVAPAMECQDSTAPFLILPSAS